MAQLEKRTMRADQAAERRQDLLNATITVIARKGLSGITVNDIAAEAGCSYGVVAFHFKTKKRLLLAALDMLVSEYEEIRLRLPPTITDSAAERLRHVIDTDFDRRVAKPKNLAVWMAFWAEAPRVPAYKARCGELKRRSVEVITELVSDLSREVQCEVDADLVARGLYAITDGFWLYNHVTGEAGPSERERCREICLAHLARFFPGVFDADRPAEQAAADVGEN
jgi:TetR/AcrR family transcriptional repressor of bet genes